MQETGNGVADAFLAALADVSPDADFHERRDALGDAWFKVLWSREFADVMLVPYQMAIAAKYVEGKISLAEFRDSIVSWPTFLNSTKPLALPPIICRRRPDVDE